MKEDTMKKESTEITDIATAIERSLENQELIKLRDWLLPMLMNGQVTVA